MRVRGTVRFVSHLFEAGRVLLDGDERAESRDLTALSQALFDFERPYRSKLTHRAGSASGGIRRAALTLRRRCDGRPHISSATA